MRNELLAVDDDHSDDQVRKSKLDYQLIRKLGQGSFSLSAAGSIFGNMFSLAHSYQHFLVLLARKQQGGLL